MTQDANDSAAPAVPPSKKRWSQRVRRALILYVVIPYVTITLAFVVFQRRLMYQPTVADNLLSAAAGLDPDFVNDIQIQTPDGITLNGWLLKQTANERQSNTPLVIYFPGNASNRLGRIYDLSEIAASGFDVLIFDYRGYGDVAGSPTESRITLDAQLVWDYARLNLNYQEDRIVIFGESLGGAVALSLWSHDSESPPMPAALILNSTFASMPRTAAFHYPMFPFRYLILDRWPSIDRIANVTSPLIIFHGADDEIIPIAQGRELSRAAPNAQFTEIKGAGHNNLPMHHLKIELERIRASMTEPQADSKNGVRNPPKSTDAAPQPAGADMNIPTTITTVPPN